jgi:hypothetical protein
MPEIEPIGEPVEEDAIAAAEKRMGRSIPPDFRDFLLEHNGGHPDPARFDIPGAEQPRNSRVSFLFGVDVQRSLNVEYFVSTFEGRIPPEMFPIGRDPGGNLILMGAEGADAGKIFFWHHEGEAEDGEPPTRENVVAVADGLGEFLKSLTPVD